MAVNVDTWLMYIATEVIKTINNFEILYCIYFFIDRKILAIDAVNYQNNCMVFIKNIKIIYLFLLSLLYNVL